MPGTRSHESPPSCLLNKGAGSTPHHRSFFPPPASSDQMLASARPSSLGNADPDLISVKLFPRFVQRNPFSPKNAFHPEPFIPASPPPPIRPPYPSTPPPHRPTTPTL